MELFNPIIPPARKPKGKLWKAVGLILVLILLIITSLLYAKIWDPTWNPFRPEPEKIIDEMAGKVGKLKLVHSDTEIGIDITENSGKHFDLSLKLSSDSDNTDSQNPKSTGDFQMALAFDGMELSLAGEGKTIAEDIYLKITKIPSLPSNFLELFTSQTGINPNQLKDQWIKINFQNLIKSIIPSYTAELEKELEKSKEKQKEIIEKIESLFVGKRLYIVKKQLEDQEIRGVKTYHYLVTFNKEEIKNTIPELYKTLILSMKLGPSPTEEQWQQFRAELYEEIDNFFAKIGDITSELWIGKKDKYLYRMEMLKEIDMNKLSTASKKGISIPSSDIEFPKVILTLGIKMDLSNFNQPVQIEAPKNYRTLEEIMGLTGGIFEGESLARDSQRMYDILMIQNIMEFYYAQKSEYPPSITIPDQIIIEESSISLPDDPGEGPCFSYQWIPNMGIDSQKFCLWACLEKGTFYAVSHKGIKELDNPPSNLDCW